MGFLTRQEFERFQENDKYWSDSRWEYIEKVIEISIRHGSKSILEVGVKGVPIHDNSDVMDVDSTYNPTILHDATEIPWPISNKKYDFFIALQVFEHFDKLRIKQKHCFLEAVRVSSNIILSLPYMWDGNGLHGGISDLTVLNWSGNIYPTETYVFGNKRKRKIYFWKNI